MGKEHKGIERNANDNKNTKRGTIQRQTDLERDGESMYFDLLTYVS